jgi:hypothetical protein
LTSLLAGVACFATNADEPNSHIAIAFDAATGWHSKGQDKDRQAAEKQALVLCRELGGMNPAIVATSAEKGYVAIAIGQTESKKWIAGLALGQATVARAKELALADCVKKGATGKPLAWVYSTESPATEGEVYVVIVFDPTTGHCGYSHAATSHTAEHFAFNACKDAGGKHPKLFATSTKRGFYGLAVSYRASAKVWVAGSALGVPTASQAKETAIADCMKNGGGKEVSAITWEIKEAPPPELQNPLKKP